MSRGARSRRVLWSFSCVVAGVVAVAAGVARGQGAPRVEVRITDATANENEVRLTGGQKAGLKVRQVLDVYGEGRVFFLPLTKGEVPVVKEQQVVASILVVDVTAEGAVGRVFGAKGLKAAQLKGLVCIPNANRAYDDQPPVFTRDVIEPRSSGWRQPVIVRFDIANEAGQRVVYSWSATGGALAAERTTEPLNRWLPPAKPGKYNIVVEALDSAGKATKHTCEVESKGVAGATRSGEFKLKRTFGIQARFSNIRDVVSDKHGITYVLENLGGLTSNDQRVTAIDWDGTEIASVKLPSIDVVALAVSEDAFYLLDRKSQTVRRHPKRGPDPASLGEKAERVIGAKGAGPGHLSATTLDIAVSPDGHTVYVLDGDQRIVHVFSSDGLFLHALGTPARDPAERGVADLENPTSLAVSEDNVLHVLDDGKQSKRIVLFRGGVPDGDFQAGAQGEELRSLAIDPISSECYILDRSTGTIKRLGKGGTDLGRTKPSEGLLSQIEKPTRIRIDGTRMLTMIERDGAALVRYDEQLGFQGRNGGLKMGSDLRLAASALGEVVALDVDTRLVTRFDRQGWVISRFGGGEQLPKPIGVAVDLQGDAFVLDAETASVVQYSRLGGLKGTSTQVSQSANMELKEVRDIQASSDRELLLIAQEGKEQTLARMDSSLQLKGMWPPRGRSLEFVNVRSGAFLNKPIGDDESSYWIVDTKGERLIKARPGSFDPRHTPDKAREVAVSVASQVFVCDAGGKCVLVFNARGDLLSKFNDEERCPKPYDLGVDDYGHAFVFDSKTERIVEFGDN